MVAEEPSTILCVEMQDHDNSCASHIRICCGRLPPHWHDSVRSYADVAAMLSLRSVDERLALYLVTIASRSRRANG